MLIINTVCKLWLLLDRESHDLYNEMFNSMNGIEGFPQEEKEACDAVRMRGILGDALYREDMSDEEMCGAIGMIIAHEISHAFDPTGAQFDATGRMKNWWTEADEAAFAERTQNSEQNGSSPCSTCSACSALLFRGRLKFRTYATAHCGETHS